MSDEHPARAERMAVHALRRGLDGPALAGLDQVADHSICSTTAPISAAYCSASARSASVNARIAAGWPGGRTSSVRSTRSAWPRGFWRDSISDTAPS